VHPERATSKIAQVCSASGTEQIPTACGAGQSCTNGTCGSSTAACPGGTADCVSSTLARVCPADGSGWLAVQCGAGQTCQAGVCGVQLDAACIPGVGACTSTTAGLQCNAAGTAYAAVACPANTTCGANANCYGVYEVGSAKCGDANGNNTATMISTTTDGYTYTTAACAANKYCVATVTGGGLSAACLTGNCVPDVTGNGCNAVCGNKVTASANQAEFISTCAPTASGWEWTASECTAPASCNPTGNGSCGATGGNPSCTTTCTPGNTRCAADGSGVQTCVAGDGGTHWSTSVTCNAAAGLVCSTGTDGQGYCGDPVCFAGTGTCTESGQFLACTNSYVLGTSPTACAAGTTCTQTGVAAGAYQPGACTAACTQGETSCGGCPNGYNQDGPNACCPFNTCGLNNNQCELCAGGSVPAVPVGPPANGGVYTCSSGGAWVAGTVCGSGTTCVSYTNTSNQPVSLCGACTPGTHQCAVGDGGVGNGAIQTCSDSGTWTTPASCTVGLCQDNGSGDFACLAQCVPGASYCGGTGGQQVGSCTANGLYPTSFANCATTGDSCRTVMGTQLGCIQCLGPNHGVAADFICSSSTAGAAGTTDTDVCGPNDTWEAPVACTGGTSCSVVQPQACLTFAEIEPMLSHASFANVVFSQSALTANASDFPPFMGGPTCENVGTYVANEFLGYPGTPTIAPQACGSTPDCCSGGASNPLSNQICQTGVATPTCQ